VPFLCNSTANEQVVDDLCERCDTKVKQRDLEQWFFKISDFAQRLLDDLGTLDGWPERVKTMQANWIGRSEGAKIDFKLEGSDKAVPCFTTRPDTIFGVTFMSLAPEHPIINELINGTEYEQPISEFIDRVRGQSTIERTSEGTEKEGIFTGKYVINPVNGERVQLWVSNYALMGYGTGAVMAVPAHDQRDFEFAKKYNLPIKVVIQPEGNDTTLKPEDLEEAYVEDGVQVNSDQFDGIPNREAIPKIINFFEEKNIGERNINFRLRDWLIQDRDTGEHLYRLYTVKAAVLYQYRRKTSLYSYRNRLSLSHAARAHLTMLMNL